MAKLNDTGKPMRSPAAELIALFFNDIVGAGAGNGNGRVYVCSLANIRNDPNEPITERKVCPTSAAGLDGFVSKWDRPRRATYFCVGTITGETRNKDAVCRSICLHGDIDFKAVIEDEPTIRMRIAELRYPPTAIVFSGHGLHLYWLLRESLDAQEHRDRIEAALRRLAEVIGGDPAVCEISRLMRLPGSHNTKNGDWIPVRNEKLDGPRYELDDLEEWLTESSRPMLTRKAVEAVKDAVKDASELTESATAVSDDDPFSAKSMGYKPRVDVEAMLANIRHPENVHDTQLRVSAALIKAGQPLEEVFEILYQATRSAPGVDPAKWNWRTEAKNLRAICEGALIKYPPEEAVLAALDAAVSDGVSRESDNKDHESDLEDASENVVNIGTTRARAQPKIKSGSGTVDHIFIGEMFLSALADAGEALMFTEQGAHRYRGGLWRLEDDKSLIAWLNHRLELCVRSTTARSNEKLIREARSWVLRQPELQRHHQIHFDAHGCVPTRSGLVNPLTSEVTTSQPEDCCTWQIPFEYQTDAKCPLWRKMLDDVFADRPKEVRADHIQIIQELLGTGLIDKKPKALSKALVAVGGSDFGKSGLIDVLAGLFGTEVNSTSMDTLENAHGLMPFVHRRPWVLHEAFDAGKWHMSSVVKALISSDPIQINVKGGKLFTHRFTAPAFWGANSSPNFKEATDAIINRIVVIECKRKFNADKPIGVARIARDRGFGRPQDLVLATEMEGVLVWALEGLRNALTRGHFVLPEDAKIAADNVRIDSNPVAGFVRDCVEFDGASMVSIPDFCAAFTSWWLDNKGEGHGSPRAERIGWAIRALGDPRIAYDRVGLRRNFQRYYAGFKLNVEGKRHWDNTVTSDAFVFQGKTVNTSTPQEGPNDAIPEEWKGKEVIQAMRAAYEEMRDRSFDHLSAAEILINAHDQ